MNLTKVAAVLCLLIPVAPVLANSKHEDTRAKRVGSIIEIESRLGWGGHESGPIDDLLTMLKRHPSVSQFKVSWREVVGGGVYCGTAIYDRNRRDVRLFAYETFEERVFRYHYVYQTVEQSHLQKLAKLHAVETEDEGIYVFAFFNELPKFGCREQKIGEYKLEWRWGVLTPMRQY